MIQSPGGEHDNPLTMDRGAWWDTVHSVAKSRTRLRDQTCRQHNDTELNLCQMMLQNILHRLTSLTTILSQATESLYIK